MASLSDRITDLAGAVRDKFNQVMPRLLPPGGSAGQALVKASNADNSVQWANPTASAAWGGITGTLTNQTDLNNALALKAPLASPALTGTPTAPTATAGANSTQIANTAFVTNAVPAVPSYSQPFQNNTFYTTAGPRSTTFTGTNFIQLVPFSTAYPMSLYSFGMNVTAVPNGAGSAKFGIYTLSQTINSRTFNLLVQCPGIASWSSSTGLVSASFSQPYSLPAGKYFIGVITSVSVTVTSLNAANGMFCDTIGGGDTTTPFGNGIAGFGYSWNYTSGHTTSSGFSPLTNVPLIGIKSF